MSTEDDKNKAKILIIEEADAGYKGLVWNADFVYNYFEKDEREYIESKYKTELNGTRLETVPRYVKIDFIRHIPVIEFDTLEDENPANKLIQQVENFEDLTIGAKSEERISPERYFNIKFRDKDTSAGFYDLLNNEVHLTYADISTNEDIVAKNTNSSIMTALGNEEAYMSSFIQDNDFYQPWAFAIYYGAAATIHSSTFNYMNNVQINSRVNTNYAENVINNIVADGSSPFSDELKSLKEAWGYMEDNPIVDSTEDYFDFVIIDDGQKYETKTTVIGYIIEKYESIQSLSSTGNKNNLIKHPNIYVKGTEHSSIIDRNVKYGGSYEYCIKTVVAVIQQGITEQSGGDKYPCLYIKTFVSAGSTKRSIFCSERIAPLPPTNLFFQYNFKEDALFINWDFPYNKQQDIKRFQIYRRKSLSEPFRLIREYDFDDSTKTDGFSPASGNENNIRKLRAPKCHYYDSSFSENSEYIYALAAIDARGLTSGYSDQFLVKYDRFTNKTHARFISKEGAPKPYPNIFLEHDALPDVISKDKVKKLKIHFNPECKKIERLIVNSDEPLKSEITSENVFNDKQEFYANKSEDINKYTVQIIDIETQTNHNLDFHILKEELPPTVEEQLVIDNQSYTSGF